MLVAAWLITEASDLKPRYAAALGHLKTKRKPKAGDFVQFRCHPVVRGGGPLLSGSESIICVVVWEGGSHSPPLTTEKGPDKILATMLT